MITRQEIRDFNYRILGYIETDTSTGKKTARNFHQRILGTYDPRENKTRDFMMRIVANGDILSSLIMNDQNQ